MNDRPRVRSYVRERGIRSCDHDGRIAAGAALPAPGVIYSDVPGGSHVRPGSRYTAVNDQPVLVDSRHRIVEVLD